MSKLSEIRSTINSCERRLAVAKTKELRDAYRRKIERLRVEYIEELRKEYDRLSGEIDADSSVS